MANSPEQRDEEAFAIRKRFPGEVAPSETPAEPPAAAGGAFSRIVLPLLLFVVIIGGIAWVTQYMPGRKTIDPVAVPQKMDEMLVRFDEITSVWDKNDKNYIAEIERSEGGHFDFPFENGTDEKLLLGTYNISCLCSDVKAAILPAGASKDDLTRLDWKSLEVSDRFDPKKTIPVPAKARGVVRVTWKGGKLNEALSRIYARLWMQPELRPNAKQGQALETIVRIVPPVMFEPQLVRIGELGARGVFRTDIDFWSATRPQVDLLVQSDADDGLIDVQVRPLSREEQAQVQAKVKSTYNTRIKCAWRAEVTVHEQKGQRQLPQGPFRRQLLVTVDGEKLDVGPLLSGAVPGEVRVGSSNDGGMVKLDRFPARSGIKKRTTLWTDKAVGLEVDGHRPAYLKVQFTENLKETTSNQRRWDLDVEVPPNSPIGPMPEDAVIILKTQSASPRQIHIPVRGSATPG